MKKRKARRYQEGGDIPDIDREPLRDSQGNIVRSGIDTFTERFNINRGISPSDKGEPVMSGSTRDRGYGEAVALGRRMREERDAAAMDEAMLRKPSQQKTTVTPVKLPTVTSTSVATDVEEPGTAGFSRTPLKSAAKPPVKAAAPVRPTSGGGRGTMSGATSAQIEEGRKKFAEDQGRRNLERLQREDKPLERVNPEAMLLGGPGLRAAKGLASLAARPAQAVRRGERTLAPEASPAGLLGRSKGAGENLSKDMGPVEFAAGKRRMLQNQRGEGVITPPAAPFAERNKRMLMQNQRGEGVITPPAPVRPPRGGGKDPGARRPTRDELDEMRMGSDYMRKGGRVKAYKSGGSVGSASKRADGIAMRGKTRGKYI